LKPLKQAKRARNVEKQGLGRFPLAGAPNLFPLQTNTHIRGWPARFANLVLGLSVSGSFQKRSRKKGRGGDRKSPRSHAPGADPTHYHSRKKRCLVGWNWGPITQKQLPVGGTVLRFPHLVHGGGDQGAENSPMGKNLVNSSFENLRLHEFREKTPRVGP